MSIRIFMFDNYTGMPIPETINNVKTEVLLGSTISDIHKHIIKDAQLFCIFTSTQNADILVQNDKDKEILDNILSFGKLDLQVKVEKTSVWYSDNARHNIIISNNVKVSNRDLSTLLGLYLDKVNEVSSLNKIKEKYTVINPRNSQEIFKTPRYSEAVTVCKSNPCSIIVNINNQVIYKSSYGKVEPFPYKDGRTKLTYKINKYF